MSKAETVYVVENESFGTTVFTYSGYDREGHPTRFMSLDDTSPFLIPQTGPGKVTVAGSLDFEKKTQHILNNV